MQNKRQSVLVTAYTPFLNLSNFLLWFPLWAPTQLPTSWSTWSPSWVRAKISLKRKSRPLRAWMGGNGWSVAHHATCSITTAAVCFLDIQLLFSQHAFDSVPPSQNLTSGGKFSHLSLPLCSKLPPQWKQGPIWPPAPLQGPSACWDSCSDDLGSLQVPWFIFWVNTANVSLTKELWFRKALVNLEFDYLLICAELR